MNNSQRNKIFKYTRVSRTQVGNLIEQLNRVRLEINKIHATPLQKLSELQKDFQLETLDQKEDHIIKQLAELKGLFGPWVN